MSHDLTRLLDGLTEGLPASGAWRTLLNVPLPHGEELTGRVHVGCELASGETRASVELRIINRRARGEVVTVVKVASSSACVEAPRLGGAVLPVNGGFELVGRALHGRAAVVSMFLELGDADADELRAPWSTVVPIAAAPAGGAPGAWAELGPAPYNATRLELLCSNPAQVELELANADASPAFGPYNLNAIAGHLMGLAVHGYHLRVRCIGGHLVAESMLATWA